MHHRSARPHQAADTSAPGQPARPRTLGTIRLRGAGVGPWARGATRPASWPARCGSARHAGGLRRPGGPARAGGRQASGPKTVGVRGHASGRRQHRTETEEPGITIIFQNRCWVCGPGVEFTGKGGEEPLSGEEGRAPPLEYPAVRRPSAGPTWREAVGSKIKFLGEGGAERWMAHDHGEFGIGPGEAPARKWSGFPAYRLRVRRSLTYMRFFRLVRRPASISLHPALRISERNNDLRRGPDLLSNEKSWTSLGSWVSFHLPLA